MRSSSIRLSQRIGSGTVVLSAILIALFVLLGLGHLVGWDPTWRTFGVTPLEPHFFDMHAVTDHVECAAKGFDAYSPDFLRSQNRISITLLFGCYWAGLGSTDQIRSGFLSL